MPGDFVCAFDFKRRNDQHQASSPDATIRRDIKRRLLWQAPSRFS